MIDSLSASASAQNQIANCFFLPRLIDAAIEMQYQNKHPIFWLSLNFGSLPLTAYDLESGTPDALVSAGKRSP